MEKSRVVKTVRSEEWGVRSRNIRVKPAPVHMSIEARPGELGVINDEMKGKRHGYSKIQVRSLQFGDRAIVRIYPRASRLRERIRFEFLVFS